jgi:hypothetical protein
MSHVDEAAPCARTIRKKNNYNFPVFKRSTSCIYFWTYVLYCAVLYVLFTCIYFSTPGLFLITTLALVVDYSSYFCVPPNPRLYVRRSIFKFQSSLFTVVCTVRRSIFKILFWSFFPFFSMARLLLLVFG